MQHTESWRKHLDDKAKRAAKGRESYHARKDESHLDESDDDDLTDIGPTGGVMQPESDGHLTKIDGQMTAENRQMTTGKVREGKVREGKVREHGEPSVPPEGPTDPHPSAAQNDPEVRGIATVLGLKGASSQLSSIDDHLEHPENLQVDGRKVAKSYMAWQAEQHKSKLAGWSRQMEMRRGNQYYRRAKPVRLVATEEPEPINTGSGVWDLMLESIRYEDGVKFAPGKVTNYEYWFKPLQVVGETETEITLAVPERLDGVERQFTMLLDRNIDLACTMLDIPQRRLMFVLLDAQHHAAS